MGGWQGREQQKARGSCHSTRFGKGKARRNRGPVHGPSLAVLLPHVGVQYATPHVASSPQCTDFEAVFFRVGKLLIVITVILAFHDSRNSGSMGCHCPSIVLFYILAPLAATHCQRPSPYRPASLTPLTANATASLRSTPTLQLRCTSYQNPYLVHLNLYLWRRSF